MPEIDRKIDQTSIETSNGTLRTWFNSLPKQSEGKSCFKVRNRYHYDMFVLRMMSYAVVSVGCIFTDNDTTWFSL